MPASEERLVKVAKALSDKTRVRILREIAKRGTIGCGEAGKTAPLSQPTMSHHIKILIDAGLVNARKEGRHVRISVNASALEEFTAAVLFASRLQR
ncbi:MAG TPA: metalloregulator ArsR/SmtB family transcription factor [Bacteroidota bacterium]|nr:metalloregulator ArsR/SmtB family transcription factor [Bacteroidota bacterium]